jgi:hypothetical protein
MREQRRLAAIVAADVVGDSRLMGRDESGTLARLREHRKLRFEPALARHGGRLVKLTGDGALVEFGSAVDALTAAIEFQQGMVEANRDQPEDAALVFRMGLHVGDLIVDGDDLYGDGVNIAARLEAEAPPGGIIVSRAVREAVEGRLRAKLHVRCRMRRYAQGYQPPLRHEWGGPPASRRGQVHECVDVSVPARYAAHQQRSRALEQRAYGRSAPLQQEQEKRGDCEGHRLHVQPVHGYARHQPAQWLRV